MTSLSIGQKMAALEATTAIIDQYRTKLTLELARRDNLILDLLEAKTPYRVVQRLTGLSRSAIIKIQDAPRRVVDLPTIAGEH